ncbi:hypothetical protein EJ131_21455 [Bacillus mycoides]|nr:hypothetical protein [Bacillus mycoides]QWH09738.1 hypothetical protein EXW49_28965 [Bacillus mycoides]
MCRSAFDYYYITSKQYTKIHGYRLEIPRCYIIFLKDSLIVRKIGISCEVVEVCFFSLLSILLCSSNRIHYSLFISK